MHERKFQNVLGLTGPERYDYFVRRVTDAKELWGLYEGGWAAAVDDNGASAVPFWPEEGFAAACAVDEWASYSPKRLDLEQFLGKWVSGMTKDGVMVAVFPTPSQKSVFVEPSALGKALEQECEQYEE